MQVKIEKKVPIPGLNRSKGMADAMRAMDVGSSFLLPDGWERASLYGAARAVGIKIAIRSIEDGMRCWRVE